MAPPPPLAGDMYANTYSSVFIPGNSYGINCQRLGDPPGRELAAGKYA